MAGSMAGSMYQRTTVAITGVEEGLVHSGSLAVTCGVIGLIQYTTDRPMLKRKTGRRNTRVKGGPTRSCGEASQNGQSRAIGYSISKLKIRILSVAKITIGNTTRP